SSPVRSPMSADAGEGRGMKEELRIGKTQQTAVKKQKAVGRKRPQATHEGIRIAECSHVFRIAENDGRTGARQTGPAIWHISRSELPGSVSRPQQSRVHREMRRFAARTRGDSLLARTARRWKDSPAR